MANRTIKRITSFLSFCIVMLFASSAFAQSAKEQAIGSQGGIMVLGAAIGLGLALIESLVIYALIIALLVVTKF